TRLAIERAGTETPHLQRGAPDFYPSGGDQGKCGPAKHAPDAAPGKRDTGAGSHTESRKRKRTSCRHTPEVKAACTVLCGVRDANRVPPATHDLATIAQVAFWQANSVLPQFPVSGRLWG